MPFACTSFSLICRFGLSMELQCLHVLFIALQSFLWVFFCFFSLICVLYSSFEILSSTTSTTYFFDLRKFLFPGLVFHPFYGYFNVS
jgi:hypothetical protein